MLPSSPKPVWRPSPEIVRHAQITRYRDWLAEARDLRFDTYDALWRWSIEDLDGFWRSIWDYFGMESVTPVGEVLADRAMPGADWFPGTRLNYVDRVFRFESPDRPAIVFRTEDGLTGELGYQDL